MHLGTLPIFGCVLQSYRNNSSENGLFRHNITVSSLVFLLPEFLDCPLEEAECIRCGMCAFVRADLHALFVVSVLLFMRILSEGPSTKRTCVWGLFLKLLYLCSFLASVLFHLPLLCPQEEEETDTKLVP